MNTASKGKIVTAALILISIAYILLFSHVFGPSITIERLTGRTIMTVNVSGFFFANCSTVIPENMSIFSSYCIGTEETRQTVFGNVTSIQFIFSYHPEDPADPWKSYNPSLPSWAIQDLWHMTRKEGYVISLSRPSNWSFEGIVKEQDTIPVRAGWNLIGYPSEHVKQVSNTFSSADGFYTQVVSYDVAAQGYAYYSPGGSNNSLSTTEPFHGYWINMTKPMDIIIVN